MDIQSLSATINQQLANMGDSVKLAEKLLALEARTGTLVQALVTEVVALNTKEQQTLLQQLNQELSRYRTGTQDPSARAPEQAAQTTEQLTKHIAGLQARLALVENALQAKALLQVVSLKLGLQQIKTLSELPLSTGDHIHLRVRADGQLELLAPAKTEMLNPARAARNLQTDLQQIAESLRQHLPRSLEKIQSIQTLDRLLQTLNRIQAPIGNRILPEATQKLIASLVANTVQPQKLQLQESQLKNNVAVIQMKQAVNNSGSLLENSLRMLLHTMREQMSGQSTSNNPHTTSPPEKHTALSLPRSFVTPGNLSSTRLPSGLVGNALSLANKLSGKPDPRAEISTTPPGKTPPTTETIFDEDNKAILLKLLEQLSGSTTLNESSRQSLQRALQDPLLAVLRSLGLKPRSDNSTQNLQRELVTELKLLVSSTLARIQTLQLRSLNQALSEFSPALLPAIELSIRVNDNIYPLVLYFQEKLLKEKQLEEKEKDKDKRKRKLARQWKVFMQFEMDGCGWFASEVSLADEKVSTRFWAERNATKTLMKSRLDALKQKMEASGLNVEEIELLAGEPPVPNTSIQQNLVDIQT